MTLSYSAALRAPMLEIDQEREAITSWQKSGDVKALEVLIRSHARQVYACAMRLSKNPSELDDLFAEGVVGLIKAAERFDLQRDVRFSTYAHWWILNSVSRAVAQFKSVVDVPSLSRRLPNEPGFAELGIFPSLSLDSTPGESNKTPSDYIQSPDPTPEEFAIAQSHKRWVHDLVYDSLNELNELEREVVVSRNLKSEPVSYNDLVEKLGFSREHLRKVERRALSRLKIGLLERGMTTVEYA